MPPTEEFDSALCNESNRAADGSAPESLPVQDSPNHDVGKVLQSLPEEFKTALLLVGVNELSYEDAARAMEVPIGTVRCGALAGAGNDALRLQRRFAAGAPRGRKWFGDVRRLLRPAVKMDHRQYIEQYLSADIDDELTPPERLAVMAHLANCPDCRQLHSAERALKSSLHDRIPIVRAPPELRDRIIAALDRETARLGRAGRPGHTQAAVVWFRGCAGGGSRCRGGNRHPGHESQSSARSRLRGRRQ